MAVAPAALGVGAVIRFVDGPVTPVAGMTDGAASADGYSQAADSAFMGMYGQVRDAVEAVYDGTSFADLAERQVARGCAGGNYCI